MTITDQADITTAQADPAAFDNGAWLADLLQQHGSGEPPTLGAPAPTPEATHVADYNMISIMSQFLALMDRIADSTRVPAAAFVVEATLAGQASFVWILRTPKTDLDLWLLKAFCQWMGGERNPHLNRLAVALAWTFRQWLNLTYHVFGLKPPQAPVEYWTKDATGNWVRAGS